MAKAFLLRWGYQNDFDAIKLQTRELGYAVDSVKLFIGTDDANVHIPNEAFVSTMITNGVAKYKPVAGTALSLQASHLPGALAYSTDDKRIQYKTASGTSINVANLSDLPVGDAMSVIVSIENIATESFNSVTLNGFTSPIRMVFLNGSLCTNNPVDTHQYTVDSVAGTLTVKECTAGDIIAYF